MEGDDAAPIALYNVKLWNPEVINGSISIDSRGYVLEIDLFAALMLGKGVGDVLREKLGPLLTKQEWIPLHLF